MTIATGNAALAADVAAIRTLATSASTAASVATANAATALSNSVAAQATAADAEATASVALSVPTLPLATSVAASNTVPIGQGGSTVAVTLATLLNSETIDLLGAATAASDTDTFMVGQGSNILVRQAMAAVWTYLQGKLPGYKIPVQEIAASKTLDATYNGQILVVTGAGVILTPNYLLMGPGFECEIVTSGSGTVTWGVGITATNGGTGLSSANAYAKLIALTSSAGNVVLASVGTATSSGSVAAPGPITGLTLGTITATSLAFSWTVPSTGGTATYYQVQYRVYGSGSPWTTLSPNPTTVNATIAGLTAATQYDVEVSANNTGGASTFIDYPQSPAATTSAGSVSGAPNAVTALAVGTVTGNTVPLTWTAPVVGTGHAAATAYTVQYRINGSSIWQTATTTASSTAYTVAGLISGQIYQFNVFGTNTSGAGAGTTINGTPTASGDALQYWGTGGYPASSIVHGSASAVVVMYLTSGANVASAKFGWSLTAFDPPTTLQGMTAYSSVLYGTFAANAPPSAGSYYGWMLFYDTGGDCILAVPATSGQTMQNGTAITPLVSVT